MWRKPDLRSVRRTVPVAAVMVVTSLIAGPAFAGIYTWTDAQGVVHYSDLPGSGKARAVDLHGLSASQSTASSNASSSSDSNSSEAADASASQRLSQTHTPRIVSPTANATIDNAASRAVVSVAIGDNDTLGPDETLSYRLDGRTLSKAPPTATRLAIDHLAPGRHQVEVRLMKDGQDTGRQDSVVFTVKSPTGSADAGQDNTGSGTDRTSAGGTTRRVNPR